ncbi:MULTISPECIES: hypothetical protein [Clavibacter]|nr:MULTISPECIES: hypothetical protein [Clavibacter]UKF26009.1 hypothetical protein KYT88_04730 [Clavibacter sp. A6099]
MLNNEWSNLMKHESNSNRRRARALVVVALTAGLGILAGTSTPAMAETRALDGYQPVGLSFYPHAYRETNPHNAELIIIDDMQGGGGPPVYAGITRSQNTSSFATTEETFGKWSYFINKATGRASNAPGTFFLRVEVVGGCGGDCGVGHWTGRISFNNPVSNGQATDTK